MDAEQLRRDIADLETAEGTLARCDLMELAELLSIEIGRLTGLLADEERRLLSALTTEGVTR